MNLKIERTLTSIAWASLLLFGNCVCLPSASMDVVPAGGFQTTNSIESKQDFLENIYADCINEKGSAVPCLKYKLFAFVDKLTNKDEINLTNGITMIKTDHSNVIDGGSPRSLRDQQQQLNQVDDKGADVISGLFGRLERFLKTHTLKINLQGADVLSAISRAGRTLDELSESDGAVDDVETARKKKKGGKVLLPLLMMLKLKLFTLIPIAFGLIALLAGKALIIGKIALLLSLIIALKKLLAHQKTVTYEIVSHPHHASSHVDSYAPASDYSSYGSSSHGGWGRSADSHDMAYSAQKPHQS